MQVVQIWKLLRHGIDVLVSCCTPHGRLTPTIAIPRDAFCGPVTPVFPYSSPVTTAYNHSSLNWSNMNRTAEHVSERISKLSEKLSALKEFATVVRVEKELRVMRELTEQDPTFANAFEDLVRETRQMRAQTTLNVAGAPRQTAARSPGPVLLLLSDSDDEDDYSPAREQVSGRAEAAQNVRKRKYTTRGSNHQSMKEKQTLGRGTRKTLKRLDERGIRIDSDGDRIMALSDDEFKVLQEWATECKRLNPSGQLNWTDGHTKVCHVAPLPGTKRL
ncbi:hypothetical protein CALVIDRAFT_543240 [Calocera viscosa TUFC12733]|uniref:Uncharacterized protein n=1 Tax=Calocera viscosa (strain TUFC12733) TaxID=1330018 RepID=A0A167FT27_CALVF|nr:hypothetical protein CALVIDRAFT_543514 [Calocera viscosa TUFC12733]KZO89815.1 hypothetical protein CALVIDRAFT_543240 [Calocera viscosa TUFC12733]